MFNKIKSLFKNKRFAFMSMFLMLAVTFSVLFIQQNKTQTNIPSNQAVVEKTNNLVVEDFLTLNYIPENAKQISSSASTDEGSWGSSSEDIQGGTEIRFSYNSNTVGFTSKDNTYSSNTFNTKPGYELKGFSIYAGNSASGTPIRTYFVRTYSGDTSELGEVIKLTSGSATCTPEDIIPPDQYNTSGNNNIFIKAICEAVDYSLSLYYDNNNDGIYEGAKGIKYKVNAEKTLSTGQNPSATECPDFGYWVLRKNAITSGKYNGYSVVIDEFNNKITITNTGVEITLTYTDKLYGNAYQLELLVSGSYGNLSQTNTNPLIAAKLSKTYNLTIDNSKAEMYNQYDSYGNILAGAYSSSEQNGTIIDSSDYQTTFPIKHSNSDNYQFFSSEYEDKSSTFFKNDDFATENSAKASADSGWYYLFNYGYRISGWKIYFIQGSNYNELKYESGKWSVGTIVEISKGNTTSFKIHTLNELTSTLSKLSYAIEQIDRFTAGDSGEKIEVSMVPTWEAVKIDIKNNDTTLAEAVNYNSAVVYNMSNLDDLSQDGQTLTNFVTEKTRTVEGKPYADIILKSAKYNYRNLSYKQYEYSSTNKNFTLNVNPEYTDNFYKVTLADTNTNSSIDYIELLTDGSGYSIATTIYRNENYTFFSNYKSDLNLTLYSSGLVETYIVNTFAPYKEEYLAGIADGYDIFKKVYQSKDTYSGKVTETWIYLTNNHEYGALPSFEKDYYSLLFYKGNNNLYLTKDYKVNADHQNEVTNAGKEFEKNEGGKFVWTLSNGGTTLTPHFFRKHYLLDVSTMFEENLGRYGYARINLNDNVSINENYIAIYGEDNKMIYLSSNNSSTAKGLSLSSFDDTKTYIFEQGGKYYLKVWAGCNITITAYDQSHDATAMKRDDNFLDCIGYKYKDTESDRSAFVINERVTTATGMEIEALGLSSGSVLDVDINFAKINYNFTIQVQNSKGLYTTQAGTFSVLHNGGTSTQQTQYSIYEAGKRDYATVDGIYEIKFNAYTGFEFEEEAFKLGTAVLQKRDDVQDQIYALIMDGEWLRDNYYSVQDNLFSYSNDATDMGILSINTQAIEFDFGIKYYDSTNTTYSDGVFSTTDKYKVKLDEATATTSTYTDGTTKITVGKELTQYSGIYVANVNGKDYAVLNSRLYLPNNYLSKNFNDYREYDFLLKESPSDAYTLTSSQLAYMVTSANGVIVPEDLRHLYLMIEVRELCTIEFVEEAVSQDPNGVRSVTISNGDNNTVNVAVTNEGISKTYTYTGITDANKKIYTYKGLENDVFATFNSKYYSSIQYYLDGNLLEIKTATTQVEKVSFETEDNHELKVKYVVRPLKAEVQYYLENSAITKDTAQTYLENISEPSADRPLYIGSNLTFGCEINNPDYTYTIKINNKGFTSNENYFITAEDYSNSIIKTDENGEEYGVVVIRVDITQLPHDSVLVYYALFDANKASFGDEYGTIEVVVDGDTFTASRTEPINVIENKSVELKLTINKGYEYYGIKHNNYSINTSEITGNSITICEEFNLEEHAGTYVIYLQKVSVTATLKIDGEYAIYSMNSEGVDVVKSADNKTVTLNNLYVGKTINFTASQHDREILDYFYYIDTEGVNYITSSGAEDGEALLSFTITQEVLNKLAGFEIEFKVVGTPKYKVVYSITQGESYIENFTVVYKGTETKCFSGEYVVTGTELNFTLSTIETGKYNIIFDGYGSTDSLETLNRDVTVTQDISIQIRISPKQYSSNLSENIYSTIGSLKSEEPTPVDGNNYTNDSIGTSSYNRQQIVLVDLVTDDNGSELLTIEISGNDSDTVKAKIVNKNLMFWNGEEYVYENISEAFSFSLDYTTNKLTITYVLKNDVNIKLDYISYKVIEQM